MSNPTHRSQRFTQAATSERNRLVRRRSQLSRKRSDLQERLDDLDEQLESVEQEITVLESFAGRATEAKPASAPAQGKGAGVLNTISGGAIRHLAVPLLLRRRGPGPIHYTEWANLLRAEGFEIAGKRPDAVFLNQVTRSPLVRATTKRGYYELDLDAPTRLEDQLRGQTTRLGTLMIENPVDAEAFERRRRTQREIQKEINRIERELREARTALDDAETSKAWHAEAA
jgi:hypothetical protein